MPARFVRILAPLLALVGLLVPSAAAATEVVGYDGAPVAGAAPTHQGERRVVGIVASPSGGYWQYTAAGGVFSWGGATYHGSTGGMRLNRPVVGMAPTPSGRGYWLVASDGGIFSFGDAVFHGSTGGMRLNRPVVGMAPTPSGRGYWLVASDGGIFSFGDAVFHGSTGALRLTRPIVDMASSPSGGGYWLVASDGGIFNFGDAAFHGSAADRALQEPVVGMAVPPGGGGYLLVSADGVVMVFGGASAGGSLAKACKSEEVVGIAARPDGGFWLTTGGFRRVSIPAGTHPVDVVALESADIARLLRFRQGCQVDTAPRGGHLGHPYPGSVTTSAYGQRTHPIYGRPQLHAGIDLAGGGAAILAAADGVVVSVADRQGYGRTTVIDHGDGVGTVYAHQSATSVHVGQRVARGQRIGTVGRTGFATGPHLHFEVRRHGAPTAPTSWW